MFIFLILLFFRLNSNVWNKPTYFLIVVVRIQVLQRYRHHAFSNVPVHKREWFARLQITAGLELILIIAFFLSLGLLGVLLCDAFLNGFEGLTTERAEAVWTWWYKQLCHLFILRVLASNMKKAWGDRTNPLFRQLLKKLSYTLIYYEVTFYCWQ